LSKKFLINAFFPGGAGGVAGEVFVSNYRGKAVKGKAKYTARLSGALAQTALWSAIQYLWLYSNDNWSFRRKHLRTMVRFPLQFLLSVPFHIYTGLSRFHQIKNCSKHTTKAKTK